MSKPKNSFENYHNQKKNHLSPKQPQNQDKSNVSIEGKQENKICCTI